jgi:hypothetical protein
MKRSEIKNWKDMPLTSAEQEIEDSIDPSKLKGSSQAKLAEVRTGLGELKRRRGGARPGAGRKPKDYVATMLNLTPEARSRLESLAQGQPGGMSGVVSRLLEESPPFGGKSNKD